MYDPAFAASKGINNHDKDSKPPKFQSPEELAKEEAVREREMQE